MQTLMQEEIYFQPQALRQTFDFNKTAICQLADSIADKKPVGFAVTGRGSSLNACYYFKYLSEILLGIPVVFLNPSVVTKYGGSLNLKDYVVFAVSQSGKAEDISQLMQESKRQGALTVAVTNTIGSPLASSHTHLYLDVGEEKSVAATKTFLSQLLIFWMLTVALKDKAHKLPTDFYLPQMAKNVLELSSKIDGISQKYSLVDTNMFVLARGIDYVSAAEISLKLKETCYINASAYPLSDFQHGPLAVLDDKSTVLMLAFDGVNADSYLSMAKEVKKANSKLIVFTQNRKIAGLADDYVLLPDTDEYQSPFAQIIAGQLLACSLSQQKGLNPDKPRRLNKVTITS